ncbi:MAG: hypothetical protein ACE5PO_06250 [Candidatus Bathyarchaeia archaeon]
MAKLKLDKKPAAKDFLIESLDNRWKYNAELVWKVWVNAPRLLAKEEGWDRGNAFIQRWTRMDGAGDGLAGAKALGIRERDARAAAAGGLYLLLNTRMFNDFVVVEWTPDRVIVRNNHCLQWEIAKQWGIAKKFEDENTFDCPAICRNWWSVLARTISADLQVTFQPAMPEGGKCCQLKIERVKS